jgi:hypothetical protein
MSRRREDHELAEGPPPPAPSPAPTEEGTWGTLPPRSSCAAVTTEKGDEGNFFRYGGGVTRMGEMGMGFLFACGVHQAAEVLIY